jgi:3-hydroxybutyryl-CoA dehydrogenase
MQVKDVKKVAVFGAGTMGPGLALVFSLCGHETALYSRKQETLGKGMATAKDALATLVAHGSLSAADADTALALIHPTQSVAEAGTDADFVVETIAENKDAKTALYAELDGICPERNVFDLVPAARQKNMVVAHFFAPAHIIPLAEVVPGPETSDAALALTVDLMKACNKTPVVMKKFGPGFIVNRIQRAIGETCMDMVQEGLVEPEQIDDAIKATLGIRLPIVGVMQTFDFQGLDMLLAYQKNVGKVYAFVEDRVNEGRCGAKSGAGIYDYQGRTEAEILAKRDELYLKMIDYLTQIGAFEPV